MPLPISGRSDISRPSTAQVTSSATVRPSRSTKPTQDIYDNLASRVVSGLADSKNARARLRKSYEAVVPGDALRTVDECNLLKRFEQRFEAELEKLDQPWSEANTEWLESVTRGKAGGLLESVGVLRAGFRELRSLRRQVLQANTEVLRHRDPQLLGQPQGASATEGEAKAQAEIALSQFTKLTQSLFESYGNLRHIDSLFEKQKPRVNYNRYDMTPTAAELRWESMGGACRAVAAYEFAARSCFAFIQAPGDLEAVWDAPFKVLEPYGNKWERETGIKMGHLVLGIDTPHCEGRRVLLRGLKS